MHPLALPGRFILAPMAGITDAAFRQQCKKYGAALCVTELTSVQGIVCKEQEPRDVLDVLPAERPAIQLFGSDADAIVMAARIVEPFASVIDFNIGCPARHITAQDAGSALLMKPEHLKLIISSLAKAVKVPVTAKIRLGPDSKRLVYKDVALALQEAGASMITLHPRTVKQGYSGKADWSRIKELVQLLDIPVCGNGDVRTPQDARRMLDETGCQYVMIGRAAAGNPFLFTQCNDYLKKGSYEEPTEQERIASFDEYLEKALEYGVRFPRLKGVAMQYSHGLKDAKERRAAIGKAKSVAELRRAMS